jgi:hypothetical protein
MVTCVGAIGLTASSYSGHSSQLASERQRPSNNTQSKMIPLASLVLSPRVLNNVYSFPAFACPKRSGRNSNKVFCYNSLLCLPRDPNFIDSFRRQCQHAIKARAERNRRPGMLYEAFKSSRHRPNFDNTSQQNGPSGTNECS